MLVSIAVLPTAAAVVYAALVPSWWSIAGSIAVGVANGLGAAWLLGRVTIGYLDTRMPDLFSRIRYGRIFRSTDGTGALDWFEKSTLAGEQQYREQQQKEREERLARQREHAGGS